MRLSASLLLPALATAASAASGANVFIFQGEEWPQNTEQSVISPEDAGLIIAKRLDVSQYHSLSGASKSTLENINKFGGDSGSVFEKTHTIPELVIVIDGVSQDTAEPLLNTLSSKTPAFTILKPPSPATNRKFVQDLQKQMGEKSSTCTLRESINPLDERCWSDRTKVIYVDLYKNDKNAIDIDELVDVQEQVLQGAKAGLFNAMVALMPETTKSSKSSYGSYKVPSQIELRKRQSEEPMTESPTSSFQNVDKSVSGVEAMASTSPAPLKGVIARCYSSLDACITATNNCSGHGSCFEKYGKSEGSSGHNCFACGCKPTVRMVGPHNESTSTTYWGGAACNKEDISSPFWLLAGFTVVIVSVVGWGIGILYSMGEEKLPSVIGAGVSSKAR
ncbi:hypothetical protein F5884DRAFT_667132 [Xylogone sp. PMI_703]|nr:hypothetical protein F5884DRAFT_667132 [Xylogone sp. PMI_703]